MSRVWLVLSFLLFLVPSAWSADLKADAVKGFIGSMEELKPYFDQYADETGDDGDVTSTAEVVADWAKSMKDQHEIEKVITKYGFDFESWTAVSKQVTEAYMAVKLGKDGEDILGQMQKSIDDIQSNKDIPADYKAQMVEQIRTSMADMQKTFEASPADQATVKPFVPKLDTIFDWQE